MDVSMYNAQADTISVDDIATNSNNRIVLRRLQRNDANDYDYYNQMLWIQDRHNRDGEDCIYYCPEGTYDMGWLGYFIGKNHHLEVLNICPFTPASGASVRDVLEPFFRGISSNKSIQTINFRGTDLLGREMFTMLGPFFRNNHNLTKINIDEFNLGNEGGRLLALALGSCKHKSLQQIGLMNNNIAEEGMVDIITALSMHPSLERLDLSGNSLRKNGSVALATLLQSSAKELRYLEISHNEINDDGMEVLVPALTNCCLLQSLYVDNNPSITTRGWQSLASILEAPISNLTSLVSYNNIDDEAAAAFASALTNNHTLRKLDLGDNPSMTAVGLRPFSKVLCDASSVNSTFLSNHTLRYITIAANANDHGILGPLLQLNRRDDKKEVATIKILQCHNDFDMQPFFEWEFKVLPLVLGWLERASAYEMPRGFEPNIEPRKLSTIYQFVRGMPVLYVETRLRKELEDIKAEESQIEEEQQKLHQEFEERMQLLQEHKDILDERKKSIVKRIGNPNLTWQRV